MKRRRPKAGDCYLIGRAASIQFSHPIRFRVIREQPWSTYEGWVWLDGYELDALGDAVERRTIYVRLGGLARL